MDKFKELISQKRVAIVGPSPHLLNSNMGEKIDSYDLVCRLNEVRPKGLEKDYGSKADILFWHLNNCDMEEFNIFRQDDLDCFNNIKMLVYPRQHGDVNKRGCGESTPLKNATKWFPDAPFYQVDTNLVKQWEDEKNAHFTVGTLSLLMLLECDFRELFICGMSFYMHGGKRYHPSHPTRPDATGSPHEVYKDVAFLRRRFEGHKNINGDEYFDNIF